MVFIFISSSDGFFLLQRMLNLRNFSEYESGTNLHSFFDIEKVIMLAFLPMYEFSYAIISIFEFI